MELVKLTHENIDKEHICCAISNNKDIQVMSKKNWLKDRLDEGLVFLKGNVRGKCFIEYIPAEYAYKPVIHIFTMPTLTDSSFFLFFQLIIKNHA